MDLMYKFIISLDLDWTISFKEAPDKFYHKLMELLKIIEHDKEIILLINTWRRFSYLFRNDYPYNYISLENWQLLLSKTYFCTYYSMVNIVRWMFCKFLLISDRSLSMTGRLATATSSHYVDKYQKLRFTTCSFYNWRYNYSFNNLDKDTAIAYLKGKYKIKDSHIYIFWDDINDLPTFKYGIYNLFSYINATILIENSKELVFCEYKAWYEWAYFTLAKIYDEVQKQQRVS